MLKVMTIVGTRPELIKMSRVIAEFDEHVNHVLVHTGQNYDYELNQVFFEDLGIRQPDYFLNAASSTPIGTISQVLEKADEVMAKEVPDALMLYGDTNSCLSVIAAKRRKIPVFHMEAGNRCFDQRVPEELNRKVVDHLSDINMVLSEHARRYLIAEGVRAETIVKTGSHMVEVLAWQKDKILESTILSKLDLKKGKYFLVSMHREENVDSTANLIELINTLNDISTHYMLPVIVSTHPRTRARIDELDSLNLNKKIHFLKPFGFSEYIRLQQDAKCVISDSGTITEEAAILKFPAITIRTTHERPEGMDGGILIMSGLKSEHIIDSINVVSIHNEASINHDLTVPDYHNLSSSKQILKIVLSYTQYINETVWGNRG